MTELERETRDGISAGEKHLTDLRGELDAADERITNARGKLLVADAASALEKRGGISQLHALMTENPERLLRNQLPIPVDPLDTEAVPVWKKLLPWSGD